MQTNRVPAYRPVVPVRLWRIRQSKTNRGASWQVRWRVGARTHPFSCSFTTEELAVGFQEDLHSAMRRGEAFDTETGLPPSLAWAHEPESSQTTWYDHARDYAEYKWPRLAASSRASTADALTVITCALLTTRSARPPEARLRTDLKQWAFIPATAGSHRSIPEPAVATLVWAAGHSPTLADLDDPARLRDLLDALSHRRDGAPTAHNTFARYRAVLHNTFKYAATLHRLETNPLTRPDLNWEHPALPNGSELDPRSVGNPAQVEAMLTAVSYIGNYRGPHLAAFFAAMYYAMLRPSEAIDLRAWQCQLPATGWGTITLESAAPAAGRRYTDTGRTHDQRGLKHRSPSATRTIPIPPRLVELLRGHLDTYGTVPDGRLFRTQTGKRLDPSSYDLVWHRARHYGLPPADQIAPRLHRPYDLRHSGISMRRTAGVPANQVAAWAGHSEQVLDRTYSKTLEGYDTRWQTQIDNLLNQAPD